MQNLGGKVGGKWGERNAHTHTYTHISAQGWSWRARPPWGRAQRPSAMRAVHHGAAWGRVPLSLIPLPPPPTLSMRMLPLRSFLPVTYLHGMHVQCMGPMWSTCRAVSAHAMWVCRQHGRRACHAPHGRCGRMQLRHMGIHADIVTPLPSSPPLESMHLSCNKGERRADGPRTR